MKYAFLIYDDPTSWESLPEDEALKFRAQEMPRWEAAMGELASVDPNSPAVQQLKAAAMPLLTSFSDGQKSEVRQLARLMGLEQVAQSF